MNYTFFFFVCASIAFGLSVISICTAPIINNDIGGVSWGNKNCERYSDEYDYDKKNTPNPDEDDKKRLNEKKRQINVCKREKAMHGLEYSSLICDVFFGGVCALLGLLHYLEVGKTIEKKTGLIGIIAGTIGFVLTLVYVVFSAYIFNNDYYYDDDYDDQITKKFSNGAILKWNGYKYIPNYDVDKEQDDSNVKSIKYRELGQKQYNYDSTIGKAKSPSVYTTCIGSFTSNLGQTSKQYISPFDCLYLWEISSPSPSPSPSILLKYIYDKWITTLILSVFIVVFNIGVILFGFFLFTQSESSPGSVPLPMSSVNAA